MAEAPEPNAGNVNLPPEAGLHAMMALFYELAELMLQKGLMTRAEYGAVIESASSRMKASASPTGPRAAQFLDGMRKALG